MTKSTQYRSSISRLSLAKAGAALTFVAVLMLGVMTTLSSQAQTFKALYSFKGGVDGQNPYSSLVRDAAGNLYGNTHFGGRSSACFQGCGLVFKLDSHGHKTLLHSFSGQPDGAQPYAGLIQDKVGNLYGTTYYGGTHNGGEVFKVNTMGKATELYGFRALADGCVLTGSLLLDKSGTLYGTASECGNGFGNVFRLSKTGTLTVLHEFVNGSSDGAYPSFTSVVMDHGGTLYGTAQDGGPYNYGVVYMLNSSGTLTLLHNFAGGATDGCYPSGNLVLDETRNLYGTTQQCGSSGGGVIWKLDKSGKETVLHNFAGGASDGADPVAGVIPDAQGNFYGVTQQGGGTGCDGGYGCGTVFKLARNGKETVLHSFSGGADGSSPFGGLIRDGNGNLYGTAVYGGSTGNGTVWRLTPAGGQ
jgi:uncharacterized repeat protein (TIGR03803 family)